MKIAFYDPFVGSGIGGIETQIRELARFFSKTEDIHVVTGYYSHLDKTTLDLIHKHDIKYHFFPFIGKTSKANILIGKILEEIAPFKKFKTAKLAFEIGIVFSSSLQFFILSFPHFLKNKYDVIFVSNSICSLISFFTKDPVVYYIGGSGWLPPIMMKRIRKFLTCSNYSKNDFERLSDFKSEVVPYGIDFEKFKKRDKDRAIIKELNLEEKVVLVGVGRLSPQKGFDYLIKALSEVKKVEKNFKLLLIGDGEERKNLENLRNKLDLKDEVIFLGKMTHDILPKYYHVSDIFILPSLYESFGIVFLEAMASGLPIISSNVAAIPEVVSNNVGILVSPKNVLDLKNAIIKLIRDKKFRIRMGEEGIKIASHFDWSSIGEKMLEKMKTF